MIYNLADRIKTARENLSLSQSALAKKLSVTRSSVNAWEMGISIPSSKRIAELASILNVSTDYLLGNDATDCVSLAGLDDDEKAAIRNMIKVMKSKK